MKPLNRRFAILRKGAPIGLVTSLGLGFLATMTYAAPALYDNGGITFNWGEAANWTGNILPNNGDDLTFNTAGNVTGSNNLAQVPVGTNPFLINANSITIGALQPASHLGGGQLTVGAGGITNNSANTILLDFVGTGLTLGAAQTWNAAAGALNVTSNVVNGGFLLTVAGASNTALSGVISGTGGITKNGAGTLTITGTNNYSGATNMNAGLVSINNSSALGTGNVNINNGGSLLGTANLTLTNPNIAFNAGGRISAATGTTLTVAPTSTLALGGGPGNFIFGTAGNTGVVTVSGSPTVITIATNTMEVAFGTLRNGGGSALNSLTSTAASTTVDAGATLDVNDVSMTVKNLLGAGSVTLGANSATNLTLNSGNFTGAISGAGNIIKNTAGLLTLGGAGTTTTPGNFTVEDGTVILSQSASNTATGQGTLFIGDGVGLPASAVVQLGLSNQINDDSAVVINSDGLFNLNSTPFGETVGSIAGSGSVNLGTAPLTTGFDDTSTLYSGVITGTGGVTKIGTGTWTLSGTNLYTGNTTITNGMVIVDGSVASVDTFVTRSLAPDFNGYLGGIGVIGGNLTNSGVVNPGDLTGDGIGTLTVSGNYVQNTDGVLTIDISPPSAGPFDVLQVGGTATLAGTLELAPTDLNSPLVDGSRVVVDTNGALVTFFDDVTVAFNGPDYGPFVANQINPIILDFTQQVIVGGQDLAVEITHDYGSYGSTPNQVAAGAMLDALVPTATGDVADFLAALDYSDQTVVEAALAALDPGSYFATASALASNNYRLHRAVETHNAAVRAASGQTVSSSSGGSYSSKGEVVSAPTVTSSGCGTTNVWGSASYDWQDFNSDNGDFDSDGETGSFTAGIDFMIANNFRLGLVAEGARTSWDGNDSDNGTEIDSYRFGLYANWGEATGWFVDALIGYNSHSVEQDRFVGLGGIGSTLSNDYDADGWQGFINVGYAIETGAGLISPFIGVEWQRLSVDETDDDGFLPIALDGYDMDSLRGLAGIKWEMALGGSSTLYASAAYAHEFDDSTDDVTVSFGGGSYNAQGLDRGDSVLLSAGLRWSVTECTTVDIGYRGELALDDNGLDSHGANVGVNFAF